MDNSLDLNHSRWERKYHVKLQPPQAFVFFLRCTWRDVRPPWPHSRG